MQTDTRAKNTTGWRGAAELAGGGGGSLHRHQLLPGGQVLR